MLLQASLAVIHNFCSSVLGVRLYANISGPSVVSVESFTVEIAEMSTAQMNSATPSKHFLSGLYRQSRSVMTGELKGEFEEKTVQLEKSPHEGVLNSHSDS